MATHWSWRSPSTIPDFPCPTTSFTFNAYTVPRSAALFLTSQADYEVRLLSAPSKTSDCSRRALPAQCVRKAGCPEKLGSCVVQRPVERLLVVYRLPGL